MPCRTYDDDEINNQNARKVKDLTAMLCAVLTAVTVTGHATAVLLAIDSKESGVSMAQISRWFAEHKEADRRRKEQEKENQERREAQERGRLAALAKLTPEDRKWLNLG